MMYDFREPDLVLELPGELDEISGLEWHQGSLLSLQDENGIVFYLDPESGSIEDTLKFDKKGDTEGLCVMNNSIFALQSDGDIFMVEGMDNDRVTRFKTGLDKDCEGLCAWSATNEILIACKERGKHSDRDIYAISIERLVKKKKPRFKFGIDANEVMAYLEADSSLNQSRLSKKGRDLVKPSGIAEHPLNHNLYVLSGNSGLLVELGHDGQLLAVFPLPTEFLPQPEGIAFSPNGDLFISSERADLDTAHLLRFSYKGD